LPAAGAAPYLAPAMSSLSAPLPLPESRLGAGLVLAAALVWSVGGVFARALGAVDPWTVVFWRSVFAAGFLLAFIALRDGRVGAKPRGRVGAGFRAMGMPGLAVALCFAVASTAFVVALEHTTVANILLVQAGVPLIAALIAWAAFGERVPRATWGAIALVFAGVAVMVSGSLAGAGSRLGDALALTVALAFALATVITRRFAQVRMAAAVCLGALLAAGFAATRAPGFAVSPRALALLFGFGALSLGLGLALFVSGARLVPAAVAALLGVAETMLGPVWVWLAFGETPTARTLLGGGLILAALLGHLAWQLRGRRGGPPG
jgi:drug/metabolite transporter (DMT)-like permease